MEILFEDKYIVVAIKPRGALSEWHEREENMPALLGGNVFPVHRLDRTVGGLICFARNKKSAAGKCWCEGAHCLPRNGRKLKSGAFACGREHLIRPSVRTGAPSP